MAKLCEDVLVLGADEPSCSNLKGDVVTLEAVSLDGGGELLVPLSLPCCIKPKLSAKHVFTVRE